MRQTVGTELRTIRQLAEESQDEILTLPEAAAFVRVSKGSIYRLTSQKLIPCSKPTGKRLYFSKRALQRWMLGSPIQAER